MQKVLILTVGGSPEPVINAIRRAQAGGALGHVYFMCSSGEKGSEVVVEGRSVTGSGSIVAQTKLGCGDYSIYAIDDPDDLGKVFSTCEQIEQDIAQRFRAGDQDIEVLANYTGGTKTMTAGLAIYTALQGNWEIYTSVGPREDLVKVKHGDLPVPQTTAIIQLRQAEDLAQTLRDRLDFEGAAEVLAKPLTSLVLSSDQRAELQHLRTELLALAAWDRFDYQAALESIEPYGDLKKKYDEKLRRLRQARSMGSSGTIQKEAAERLGYELVEDILENAERCAKRKRYDDAVARLYRATELLAQVRLKFAYGLCTSSIDPQAPIIPDKARAWLCKKPIKAGGSGVELGLRDGYFLLSDLEDPVGRHYKENKDSLKHFLDCRNHSLFAHGFVPIGEDWWNKNGQEWTQWIRNAMEISREVGTKGHSC